MPGAIDVDIDVDALAVASLRCVHRDQFEIDGIGFAIDVPDFDRAEAGFVCTARVFGRQVPDDSRLHCVLIIKRFRVDQLV